MKKFLILPAVSAALLCVLGLSACADKTEYSIACQASENGYVIVADTKVEAGEKVILAAHPSAGYRHTAFLVDGEVIDGVSFVMPGKDVTVSAQFELITYSITYVLNEAAVVGNNPDTYTVASAAELIAPEKDGYEICGWYRYCTEAEYNWDMEDFRVISLEGLFGNLTLFAKYYNPLHQINVGDIENGRVYVEDYIGEACYGDTINVEIDPYYGYELDCLLINGEAIEGTSFIMPAGAVEITAVFKPVRYAIRYELDGGNNSPDNPEYYTIEDWHISFYEAEKEGYIFYGWYYDEDHTEPVGYGFEAYDCRPITLYAWFVADDEEWE